MDDRCWAEVEERRSAVHLVQDLEDSLLQFLWWSVLREPLFANGPRRVILPESVNRLLPMRGRGQIYRSPLLNVQSTPDGQPPRDPRGPPPLVCLVPWPGLGSRQCFPGRRGV